MQVCDVQCVYQPVYVRVCHSSWFVYSRPVRSLGVWLKVRPEQLWWVCAGGGWMDGAHPSHTPSVPHHPTFVGLLTVDRLVSMWEQSAARSSLRWLRWMLSPR